MSYWHRLPYRQKNHLLLLLTGAGLLLAYLVAIRPTLALYEANTQQRQALDQLRHAPTQTRQLQSQAAHLTWLLRSFSRDSAHQDGDALNQLTRACRQYRVTLASLSPGERTHLNGYTLETRVAKLRGGFRGLAQVVYALEYRQPVGRLSSVRFALEEDRRQRRSFLYAYLYLQTISSQQHADR